MKRWMNRKTAVRMKDIIVGQRVNTKFGPATVRGISSAKYVDVMLEKAIPGRRDMTDKTWQTFPRNIQLLQAS